MSVETDQIEADLNESRNRLNSTLEQLGEKLSPSQIVDEAVGFARGQVGQATTKVVSIVKTNPLPFILIGAGVALLVMNRNSNSNGSANDWSSDRRHRTLEEARWATPRMPNEADDAYEERVHSAYASSMNLKQKAGEALHEFKDRVAKAATAAKSAVGGVGQRVTKAASGVKGFASDTAHNVSDRASEGVRYVGRTATQARDSAEEYYDGHPLAVGAIAVAIGAAIGSLAPLSRQEREGLRGIADTAARTGADLAERGRQLVEERMDTGAVH